MLIGPKGLYHKMLEDITGCVMYIKGKAAQTTSQWVLTGISSDADDCEKSHIILLAKFP